MCATSTKDGHLKIRRRLIPDEAFWLYFEYTKEVPYIMYDVGLHFCSWNWGLACLIRNAQNAFKFARFKHNRTHLASSAVQSPRNSGSERKYDLLDTINQVWRPCISIQESDMLYSSMPHRISASIKDKGEHIKWSENRKIAIFSLQASINLQ